MVKSLILKLASVAHGNVMRCLFGLVSAFFRLHVARYIPSSRLKLKAKPTPPFRQTSHSNGITSIDPARRAGRHRRQIKRLI